MIDIHAACLFRQECHYAPTRGGAQDAYINDSDLLDQSNVVILLCSATPYNCLTKHSRIVNPDVSKACDPLKLKCDDVNLTNNVFRWRPDDKGRYRSLDFYVDSIAFRAPSKCNRLSIIVNGTERTLELDHNRLFGSIEAYAKFVSHKLKQLKLQLSLSFSESRFAFKRLQEFECTLKFPSFEDDSVLPLLGFKTTQCGQERHLAPFNEELRADDEAKIDDDYPVDAQRIRSDARFKELQTDFNNTFGSRMKRSNSNVGTYKVNGCSMEITIEDGHLLMCDYLFSLAYFALARVNPKWYEPGEKMLRSLDDSMARLKNARSVDELFNESPIRDSLPARTFDALLRHLASGEPQVHIHGKDSSIILESYDMVSILCDFMLIRHTEMAEKQMTGETDDPLYYIFDEKLKGEKNAATTTDPDSWYTETDRNVRMLLDQYRYAGQDGNDGNGKCCIWGQIILMRVYDNQENMTMQTILREALEKLGLACGSATDNTQPRAFSVLSDISNTDIAEAIEPYFLEHDLRRFDGDDLWSFDSKGAVTKDEAKEDPAKRTLARILHAKKESKAQGIKKPHAELCYEDLHNLPMLLIVTNKARMGNTFPHSLASLDLRMRTGKHLVGLIQELGRMCRYPSTRKLLSGCTLKQLREDKRTALERELERELPLMVVRANGSDRDIVCHIFRKEELGDNKRFGDASGVADDRFDVHVYVDKLPRAIILKDVQDRLVKALDVKALDVKDEEHETSALHCARMKKGLDPYMNPIKQLKAKELHTYHENYTPVVSSTKAHYDASADKKPPAKHKRRMLLFAECQIGKTAAYLHYLTRLREVIRGSLVFEATDSLNQEPQASWHFPYWRTVSDERLDYKQPKKGYYHNKVVRQRKQYLRELAKGQDDSGDWLSNYCSWLKSPRGEMIVSKAGVDMINKIEKELESREIPFEETGGAKTGVEHEKTLMACIDWDGRMERLKGQLDDRQQPGYNAANSVWDNPVSSKGGQQVKCPPRSEMCARREPPESAGTNSFKTHVKTLKSDKFLASDANYTLHVPQWMHLEQVQNEHLELRWIFTCSYGGASKDTCRLNRESAMEPLTRDQYVQVLVVRDDEYKDGYLQLWSSSYIIAVMPKEMHVKYANGEPLELSVKRGGIGYARLFCQLLASSLKRDEIWMLDDNVEQCWTIETDERGVPKLVDGKSFPRCCRFSSVMQGVELLLDKGTETRVKVILESSTSYEEHVLFDVGEHLQGSAGSTSKCKCLSDYTHGVQDTSGAHHAETSRIKPPIDYGILGLQRADWRHSLSKSSGFSAKHSIYSFFLLNVKETIDKGVMYPAKPIWEDIEFLHMVTEADLAICRFNKYILKKKHRREHEAPPPPPPMASLEEFLKEKVYEYEQSAHALIYEVDSDHKWSDTVCELIKKHSTKSEERDKCHVRPLVLLFGFQIPRYDASFGRIITKLQDYARCKACTELIILVEYTEVNDFTPSEDDMLFRMRSLSRKTIEENSGNLFFPQDGMMVEHDDQRYYVIEIPVSAAPHTGTKRKERSA